MSDPTQSAEHTARIVAATMAANRAQHDERSATIAARSARVRLIDARAARAAALATYDTTCEAEAAAQDAYDDADLALLAAITEANDTGRVVAEVYAANQAARDDRAAYLGPIQ